MNRLISLMVLPVLVLGGFWAMRSLGSDPSNAKVEKAREELLAADRAFDKATLEKGLDGWMEFMAEDAVRLSPMGARAFQGTKSVRELDAKLFATPGERLRWEPIDAGLFEGGGLGFTTGKGRMVRTKEDGTEETLWKSNYVTMWRKDTQGRWKVILDTGSAQD